MKQRIILASSSPRRRGLLQQIGLKFEVLPSNTKEDAPLVMPPRKFVEKLAEKKAKAVADKMKEGIIIGADTILVCGRKKLGKPKDRRQAIVMLRLISGKTLRVYSGIAIIDAETGRKVVGSEVTAITLRKLTNDEILSYVNTGEPLGKAGAIAIQGLGAIFVSGINGCSSNVVGLPLYSLYKNLKKFGVDIFESEKQVRRS